MAAASAGVYQHTVASAPKLVALPQQKKIMEDVLDCIITLKSEFFENHQPINDDNITLQRLCAKLEHLIQIGMREKTSLLGRKKDYWDYFCDCLGAAKGSNDGIRFVKSLREYKTSLGKGRAFIRFCLVHQRLADAMQQCFSHQKTSVWFNPKSVLCDPKDSTTLVSALYDLNSMHFDLAPRGYDLDSDWPSFSNRKTAAVGGSWNIPISRRSSLTSMDTVSQASFSLATSPDVDRLHKDLEEAQSAHNDAQDRLGTLEREKEEVSQSAWESQGKVTSLMEQLEQSQSQYNSLQDRYRQMDVSFMRLKLEKEHIEKLLSDERKNAKELEIKRVQQLQEEEEVWKREMREEGERRRKEIDRLMKELTMSKEEADQAKMVVDYFQNSLADLMKACKIESESSTDYASNIDLINSCIEELQAKLERNDGEQGESKDVAAKALLDYNQVLEVLEKREKEMEAMNDNLRLSANRYASLESKYTEKQEECKRFSSQIMALEKDTEKSLNEIKSLSDLNTELKDKEKTLKELNKSLRDRTIASYVKDGDKGKLGVVGNLDALFSNWDEQVMNLQRQVSVLERSRGVSFEGNEDETDGRGNLGKLDELRFGMEQLLKERESTLKLILMQMKEVDSKCFKFQKEIEVLEHGGQMLNSQLTLCEAKLAAANVEVKEKDSQLNESGVKVENVLRNVDDEKRLREKIEKEKNELIDSLNKVKIEVDLLQREKDEFSKSNYLSNDTEKMVEIRNNLDKDTFVDLNKNVITALRLCNRCLNQSESDDYLTDMDQNDDGLECDDINLTAEILNANVIRLCHGVDHLCSTNDSLKNSSFSKSQPSVTDDEKERLLNEVDSALEETHTIRNQLVQTSELLAQSNSSVDMISAEKDGLETKVNIMLEELSRHEAEKEELRQKASVLKADCDRAEDDLQEKIKEKRDLELLLEEKEEKLESLLRDKSVEKDEGLTNQSDFSHQVLEDSLIDSNNALEKVKADKIQLEEKYSKLEKEKTTLEVNLRAATERCEELESQGGNSQSDVISELQDKLVKQKAQFDLDVDTLESEISSLKFQLSSQLISRQEELQSNHAALPCNNDNVAELEERLKELEEENEKLTKRKEEEEESMNDEKSEVTKELTEKENLLRLYKTQAFQAEDRAQMAKTEKIKARSEVTEIQKKMRTMELEMDTLRSDNDALKKQLRKLIRDKDSLWQKTDALVDERKKKTNERWMDNSKVTHCGLCKTEFSLFVRKHHCRFCGAIFCWGCSDNWLDTPHSSKKVRACLTCYEENNRMNTSMMATSLLGNDSDEDDGGISRTSSFTHTIEDGNVQIRQTTPGRDSPYRQTQNGTNSRDGNIETDEDSIYTPALHNMDSNMDQYDGIVDKKHDTGVTTNDNDDQDNDNGDNREDEENDCAYQLITEAQVVKTMADYKTARDKPVTKQDNMTSSMTLSANDLESGEVNRRNEIWIRPGKMFVVPIHIAEVGENTLSWQFSSMPKDIVFSLKYSDDENTIVFDMEEIVSPCKCDAHKQTHHGELTPKKPGTYTLVFDNTYSRLTSKKIEYQLDYQKPRQ